MLPSLPDGDLAEVIEAAVTEKLRRLESKRFATSPRRDGRGVAPVPAPFRRATPSTPSSPEPPPSSRHIPADVRRAVWLRDGGRCRYVDGRGRRCTSTERLEFHHRHPHAYGGRHDVANLSLLCRTHNSHLAEIDYGRPTPLSPNKSTRRAENGATPSAAPHPTDPAATG